MIKSPQQWCLQSCEVMPVNLTELQLCSSITKFCAKLLLRVLLSLRDTIISYYTAADIHRGFYDSFYSTKMKVMFSMNFSLGVICEKFFPV